MPNVHLYSAKACPFAHRTRLVLGEKGVPFELTEVDLQNKPAWFGSVSLYGKVPALEHDGRRIVESAIINEYLDEVFPTPSLLPSHPADRAIARIWIDYANTRFTNAWSTLLRGNSEGERETARKDLDTSVRYIEKEALARLSGGGPFWLGSEISLVDLTFYPWFERWPALSHYRGYAVPPELERLNRWRDAVAARPSVRATENPHEFYLERYARFATPERALAG